MNAPVALPPHVVVLRDFANTIDEGSGVDALPNPGDLVRWLDHYGLLPTPDTPPNDAPNCSSDAHLATATPAHLDRAARLRAGLRHAMSQHHDGMSTPLPQLDELARDLPLRVDFSATQPRLSPVGTGADAGLSGLLVAVMAARADHSWPRLKVCRASDCRWAFYDSSKNRSRTWCDMGVCGNRAKTRTYRARRRAADA